jgi:hypothetical protein
VITHASLSDKRCCSKVSGEVVCLFYLKMNLLVFGECHVIEQTLGSRGKLLSAFTLYVVFDLQKLNVTQVLRHCYLKVQFLL